MHVESGIPNLEFRTVYDQPFLSQRWAHSHHCNRKYLRFELSIWSILDVATGQLNQHLKFLVHVKTNTGIYTVSIPFPCFLPELQLYLSLISDLHQMATGSNIITSIVCYFHCIALFIHMQGLQHWPVSLLLSASSCAVRHCANGLHLVWLCGMQDTSDAPSPVQSLPPLADYAIACHAVPGMERCFSTLFRF